MKFPVMFTRGKGGGNPTPVLGTDALLVDSGGRPRKANPLNDDNVLSVPKLSVNGWPISRVALAAKYTGGGVAAALPVSLFAFEDNLGIWLPLAQSAGSITPGTAAVPTGFVFFDVLALNDLPATSRTLQTPESGACEFLCVVSDNGSGNGRYDFILGAELTATPF